MYEVYVCEHFKYRVSYFGTLPKNVVVHLEYLERHMGMTVEDFKGIIDANERLYKRINS